MSAVSKIEWTDASWNPVRGCTKISPGCAHCYAETFAERFRGVPGHAYEQGFDLFHKDISDDYVVSVAKVMELANWHTYQVLTKRSERMRDLLSSKLKDAAALPHIWWGVSVENIKHGLPRIDHLRQAPAAVRFLSIEPLLEDVGPINLEGISWVIVGGESGAGARPMAEEWVLSIKDQCQQAQVPFFFKQWGGWNKKKAGRILDGRTYDEMPGRATNPVPSRMDRMAMMVQVQAMIANGAATV